MMRCREARSFLNWKSIIGGCLAALIFSSCLSVRAETSIIGHHVLMILESASFDENYEITLPDGGKARLSGIDLPMLPPGGSSAALKEMVSQSRALISALAEKTPLVLWVQPGQTPDRWGRLAVQIVNGRGEWIQADILQRGLARVLGQSQDKAVLTRLLEAEKPARQDRTGIWALPRYALRNGANMLRDVDSIQVVEGNIVRINATRNAIYLGMGENQYRDVSVKIPRRLFEALGSDPAGWLGWRIRVRGWVGKGGGPVIAINDSLQIEFVEVK